MFNTENWADEQVLKVIIVLNLNVLKVNKHEYISVVGEMS